MLDHVVWIFFVSSCVTRTHTGDGARAKAPTNASMLARSSAGTEQVSMVVRRPLTICASTAVNSAPWDLCSMLWAGGCWSLNAKPNVDQLKRKAPSDEIYSLTPLGVPLRLHTAPVRSRQAAQHVGGAAGAVTRSHL